jgi:NNP family nitrate/nitrite transporter-like MFS transporter
MPGRGRPLRAQLEPLRELRVWRFSLYYVAVFGAYVALAAWLPKYYVDNFDVDLSTAALLTATFIFPASLLRPLGGWFSDRWGARRAMYWTFGVMMASTLVLSMPNGHIVVQTREGAREVLPYSIGLVPFAVVVFILGCSMGIGKAAVFKHIPEYFPHDVGAVGGLVGMLGGLGGFLLPPLFAYSQRWTGFPSSTFFVLFLLTVVCSVWMHWTVVRMLHEQSPELATHLETPPTPDPAAGGTREPEEARA